MALDKTLLAGSSATLVLKLLDGRDMYGYQIIEELACPFQQRLSDEGRHALSPFARLGKEGTSGIL